MRLKTTAEIWLNRYKNLLTLIYDTKQPIERRKRAVKLTIELVNRLRKITFFHSQNTIK